MNAHSMSGSVGDAPSASTPQSAHSTSSHPLAESTELAESPELAESTESTELPKPTRPAQPAEPQPAEPEPAEPNQPARPNVTFDGVVRANPSDPDRSDAGLPTPAVQNHAANLTRLPNGDLACVWFAGTQEGVSDVSVYLSRLPEGGDQWTPPVKLSDDPGRSEQNPVLFVTPQNDLWLLFTAQLAGNQDSAEVRRRVSRDGGETWGEAETFLAADSRGGVFVRQPIVVTRSGRWLLPIFRCVPLPGEQWRGDVDTSAVAISDNDGKTWRTVEVPESLGCVHMNIVATGFAGDGAPSQATPSQATPSQATLSQASAPGRLRALYRSRWADAIYASESLDDGESWSAPKSLPLPNNNSSIQCILLQDGRLALVFNRASRLDAASERVGLYDEITDSGIVDEQEAKVASPLPPATAPPATPPPATARKAFWGAPRAPMTLAISDDAGDSWVSSRDLDVGDGFALTNNSRDRRNREYSYPSILQAPDGRLEIAYTCFRQGIKFSRVPLGWVAG